MLTVIAKRTFLANLSLAECRERISLLNQYRPFFTNGRCTKCDVGEHTFKLYYVSSRHPAFNQYVPHVYGRLIYQQENLTLIEMDIMLYIRSQEEKFKICLYMFAGVIFMSFILQSWLALWFWSLGLFIFFFFLFTTKPDYKELNNRFFELVEKIIENPAYQNHQSSYTFRIHNKR